MLSGLPPVGDVHRRPGIRGSQIGREKLGEQAEQDILIFLHDFIINVLEDLRDTTFFIVVFDNCSEMSAPSWRLFDLLA